MFFLHRKFPEQLEHDWDEDGYSELDGDCDDRDANIKLASIWYVDSDGDGYGLDSLQTESCTRPEGYTDQVGDCNDNNEKIHPEAFEICNDDDDDCDGLIDDADSEWLQSSGKYFYYDHMEMALVVWERMKSLVSL